MMWVCVWELHSTVGKLVSGQLEGKGAHQASELGPWEGRGGAGASWSALLWEEGQRAILKKKLTRALLHIRISGGE